MPMTTFSPPSKPVVHHSLIGPIPFVDIPPLKQRQETVNRGVKTLWFPSTGTSSLIVFNEIFVVYMFYDANPACLNKPKSCEVSSR